MSSGLRLNTNLAPTRRGRHLNFPSFVWLALAVMVPSVVCKLHSTACQRFQTRTFIPLKIAIARAPLVTWKQSWGQRCNGALAHCRHTCTSSLHTNPYTHHPCDGNMHPTHRTQQSAAPAQVIILSLVNGSPRRPRGTTMPCDRRQPPCNGCSRFGARSRATSQ